MRSTELAKGKTFQTCWKATRFYWLRQPAVKMPTIISQYGENQILQIYVYQADTFLASIIVLI